MTIRRSGADLCMYVAVPASEIGRAETTLISVPCPSVDQRLRPENDREREALGVLRESRLGEATAELLNCCGRAVDEKSPGPLLQPGDDLKGQSHEDGAADQVAPGGERDVG
jgi:hypothetical protein